MKVLLIGSYPPPLGGVSVFLQRYKKRLEGEGHSVDVLDPTKTPNLKILTELLKARAQKYDLISVNYPSIPLLRTLRTLGLASKTEYWDHNWRLLESWTDRERQFFESFLSACHQVLLVSSELREEYTSQKIALPPATRIQNAFIPPTEEDRQLIIKSYPDDIRKFIEQRQPLIVANAFKLILQQGVDLYGVDMCLELSRHLLMEYPNLGFVFALAEIGEKEYFESIGRRISELGLKSNFRFLTGQKEFWPLLKKANLMVRPTMTDGYALSVAEAVYFKCAVVASDVAVRPQGVILFKSRDTPDFIEKCRMVLSRSVADESV